MRLLAVTETWTSFGSPLFVPFAGAGWTVTSEDTGSAEVLDVLAEIDWVLSENAVGARGDRLRAVRTAVFDPARSHPVAAPPPKPRVDAGPPASRLSATHLDRCLGEIQDWLGIGLAATTQAAGINRGTVYAWRERGTDPRPGTVGAILRVHGLVASAVADAGEDRTRAWFHAGDPSPLTELLDAHGQAAALALLGRRMRRSLTRPPLPPPNPLLSVTVDDEPVQPVV